MAQEQKDMEVGKTGLWTAAIGALLILVVWYSGSRYW